MKSPRAIKNFGYRWYCGGCPNKDENNACICGPLCNSPQNICIKNKKENERIMKYVYEDRHGWSLIQEHDILNLVDTNACFLEILDSYPKKIHFDIDGNDPNEITLDECKQVINKYFPNAKMAISGYETDNKKSYHIILPEYIINDDNDLLGLKKIVKDISQTECKYFDWKIYTKNRAMKCINQSKPNGEVQKIIENNKKEDHFICSFFTGKEKVFKFEFPEDVFMPELKLNELPVLTAPLKLVEGFTKEDLSNSKKLLSMAPISADFNHAYVWKVALFSYWNGLSFDDFWEWAKIKNDSIERKNKWQNIHWLTISSQEYKMSKNGFIQLLSFYYPELDNIQNEDDFITQKFIRSLDLNNATYIDRITDEHFLTEHKATIFNIGMGGGKTTMTVNYLEKTNKNFIWITPRQALVMNTYERFKQKKMDVLNYLDCGSTKAVKIKNINKANKIILEAESLNKLQDCTKYDTIIIDEIETVLKGWDSETHIKNNLEQNFNNFISLLKNCKKIILLDAFTTTATLDLLKMLDISYITYMSKYKPTKKILKENLGYSNTIEKIASELDLGKKLYIFHAYKSSTKNHYSVEEFKSKLLELCQTKPKILVYHGDICDSKKKTLYNVNEEWDKYDCIITTSSITVGVNYEGSKFDKVYLMIAGSVNNVRDVIQTSMRIRKTNEDIIEIFIFDKMYNKMYKYPEYYNTCNNEIYRKIVDNIAIEKQSNFMDSFYKFCDLTNYECPSNLKSSKSKKLKFINDLYTSKMLIPYNKISKLTEERAEEIETTKIWSINASQYDKFSINRYYFDIKFRHLDEKEREFIWDNRYSSYFSNINSPLIQKILDDNKAKNLASINYNKIVVSDETNEYIAQYFKTEIKSNKQKISKLINIILECQYIQTVQDNNKNISYAVIDDAIYLNYIHEKMKQKESEKIIIECDFIDEI